MTGRPGGLVATREYYERWSLSSIPTVVRFDFTCKNKWKKHKKGKLLRALSSVGRYNSTRVNKGRKWWIFFAIKKEGTYRSAEGGEEGPLCDSGSELLLGGSARVMRG